MYKTHYKINKLLNNGNYFFYNKPNYILTMY